jgi:hypothetical protein
MAMAYLRLLHPVGVVWRVLCGGSATPRSGRRDLVVPEYSMAASYADRLLDWLPWATEVRLLARHEGRSVASVNAFVEAAKGRPKTLTFVETENGGSICGGYLDVAWVEGDYASDQGRRSFIFTLKNHLGVPPTKFAHRRETEAAYMRRGDWFYFGHGEGFKVWQHDVALNGGRTYEAPGQGVALFNGDGDGKFRAARWELWEVE